MLKRYLIYTLIITLVLVLVLVFVDPTKLSSTLLFAVLALIYGWFVLSIMCILLVCKLLTRVGWQIGTIRRVALSAALLPTFLLLLQSVGQLTPRDTIISVVLTLLIYFYSQRMFVSDKDKKESN